MGQTFGPYTTLGSSFPNNAPGCQSAPARDLASSFIVLLEPPEIAETAFAPIVMGLGAQRPALLERSCKGAL
jgi:hypothetical protein